jgi:hypothetical protein
MTTSVNSQSFFPHDLNPKSEKDAKIFLGTSVSESEQKIASITDTKNLAAIFNLINTKGYKRGLDLVVGFNFLNTNPFNSTRIDSQVVSKQLFPESGNSGVATALQWYFYNQENHSLVSSLNFSWRTNKISLDTTDTRFARFNSLNYTIIPITYIFHKAKNNEAKKDIISFYGAPYVNWTNIPNEEVKEFNKIFPAAKFFLKDAKSFLPSVGVKLQVAYKEFSGFADFRQMTRNETINPLYSADYSGFLFNVGVAASVSFLSF